MMIHIISHRKGGVGKSTIASYLAQYYKSKRRSYCIIDADPIHESVYTYKGLNVRLLDIFAPPFHVDLSQVGSIFEDLPDTENLIIDVGMCIIDHFYVHMEENNIIEKLKEQGHEIMMHSVVTNGACCEQTFEGLEDQANRFANSQFVVWCNKLYSRIDINFEGSKLFTDLANRNQLYAIVNMPSPHKTDFLHNSLAKLLSHRLTFNEASDCPQLSDEEILTLIDFKKQNYNAIEMAKL